MIPTTLLVALSGAAILTAPKTPDEVRKVGPFEGLAVEGSLTVEVARGAKSEVVLVGPAALREKVRTTVREGTLHVAGGGSVAVRVTTPTLSDVVVAGSGNVAARGPWKADSFSVAIAGAGGLSIDLEAESLDIAIAGSGTVHHKGSVGRAEVAIEGSGSIELGVRKQLKAAIVGSGSVRYRGSSDVKVEVATMGSGHVSRLD